MARFTLDLASAGNAVIIRGPVDEILRNARFVESLKRLGHTVNGSEITVGLSVSNRIEVLLEVSRLAEKFGLDIASSASTAAEFSSLERERNTFREFTKRARQIRDNEFLQFPELIKYFDSFQAAVGLRIKRTLYARQLLSAFHLAYSQNACNFSVPGAGKTTVVLAAYAFLNSLAESDTKYVSKLLVVGPLSSFAPWEDEFEVCFGRKANSQRLSGDATILREHKEQHLYSGKPAELTLISHQGVDRLLPDILSFLRKHPTMVIVDEAHRIKNPDGVWGRSVVEIAKEARARVVLTGTPVPNGYEDLFNLFQFLYPFKFKDILQLHYANLAEMSKNPLIEEKLLPSFNQSINPFFIRIRKADLGLPPIEEKIVTVPMQPDHREIYDFIESKAIRAFQDSASIRLRDALTRARLIRLRQAATNPALLLRPIIESLDTEDDQSLRGLSDGSVPEGMEVDAEIMQKIKRYSGSGVPAKFETVERLFRTVVEPAGGKLLVWSIFIQNAKTLSGHLQKNGIDTDLLIGEVDQLTRERVVKRFNDPSESSPRIVIANPFAVAESISLHKGCHYGLYLERDYNCATFLQSKDRIHRYGLDKNIITTYFYLLSQASIDEIIHDRLVDKTARMEKIIDSPIPLFARIDVEDDTDIIKALLSAYAKRT